MVINGVITFNSYKMAENKYWVSLRWNHTLLQTGPHFTPFITGFPGPHLVDSLRNRIFFTFQGSLPQSWRPPAVPWAHTRVARKVYFSPTYDIVMTGSLPCNCSLNSTCYHYRVEISIKERTYSSKIGKFISLNGKNRWIRIHLSIIGHLKIFHVRLAGGMGKTVGKPSPQTQDAQACLFGDNLTLQQRTLEMGI